MGGLVRYRTTISKESRSVELEAFLFRYSFNGGSALVAGGQAATALMNTHIASCTAGCVGAHYPYSRWQVASHRTDEWHLCGSGQHHTRIW